MHRGPAQRLRRITCIVLVASACGGGADRFAGTGAPQDAAGDGAASAADASVDAAAGARDATPRWPHADLEVEAPYGAGVVTAEISLAAETRAADVHLNIDTTSSFDDEIDELQRDLRSFVLPELRARIPDLRIGVSRFEDFPTPPFGVPRQRQRADTPFELLTPVTDDLPRVFAAVARLDAPLGRGGDTREAGAEALFQVATGAGYAHRGLAYIAAHAPPPGALGGADFRPQTLHFVVHVTDAQAHLPGDYGLFFPGTRSMQDAQAALVALPAHVVGVVTQHSIAAREELSAVALATGTVMRPIDGMCPTGVDGRFVATYEGSCPLVYDVTRDGAGLAATLVDGLTAFLRGITYASVHVEVAEDPLRLVRRVYAVPAPQAPGVASPDLADLEPPGDPDGAPDTFLNVERGAALAFGIEIENDRIAPGELPQRFRVVLRVIGDALLLTERVLRVVVPTTWPPTDGGPAPATDSAAPEEDAGADAG